MVGCDLSLSGVNASEFNRDHPSGRYDLDLSNPNQRAIWMQILQLAHIQEGDNIFNAR
jgi:hypothetical protein